MRFNLKKTIAGIALAASTMYAADVSFSGYILGGTSNLVDSEGTITYGTYHEIDLTTSVKFSEKASVDIFSTMADAGDDRWAPVLFDGLTLNYGLDMGTLMVGDLVYNNNKFGYYYHKRTSPVLPETFVRGLGIDTKSGISAYYGSLDGASEYAGGYLSYTYDSEGLMVKPYLSIALGDEMPLTYGLDFGLTAGALSLNAALGSIVEPDMDPTYNVLVEPSFDAGSFNVVASIYYSAQSDSIADRSGYSLSEEGELGSTTGVTEEMFIYVEPGVPVNDIFAVGLPLEYHSGNKDDKSAFIGTYPTLYFSVADDASFLLWAGVDQGIGDTNKDDDAGYSFGSELTASF